MINCPCVSGQSYHACCQPLHEGIVQANSAEQLMCSRYSAFSLGKIEYLVQTLHPDFSKSDDRESLKLTIEQTNWLGLKIIEHKAQARTATVEFVAYFAENPIGQMHELSRFVKQDGKWFYQDGDFLPPLKLSRNEACFCGSGKKLKKCHLR